jgi:nitrous oxidase accessory protein
MFSPTAAAPFLFAWILVACADERQETVEAPCRTCATMDHATHSTHTANPASASPIRATGLGALGARIAGAPAFAKIVVPAGVYREPTIVITKPVELVAEPGAILDGEGARTVFLVLADDVTVTGFTIRNTGSSQVGERAGIKVSDARRCLIVRNQFHNTAFGVYLEKTSGCVVRDNVLHGSGATQSQNGNGIHAWSSEHVTVLENDITGHRDGIYFEFVRQGRVAANVSEGNIRYGLHFMYSDSSRY